MKRKSYAGRGAFLGSLLVLLSCPLPAQIAITEIMYNAGPADEEGRMQEFVELFNTLPEPVNLAGYQFTRGLIFTFPDETWLAGHSYLVVCADAGFIGSQHGITNVIGDWDVATALANGGETISIADPSGVEVVRVRYNDRGKWPAAADGTGHTLSIINPYSEVDDPDSWAHSAVQHGSPGRANPAPGAKPVIINEGLMHTAGERWVEVYNPSTTAVNLGNHYLTDDPLNLTKARLGPSLSIPAKGWLAFHDAALGLDFTPVPNPPNPGVGRAFVALVDAAGTRVIDAYTFEPDLPEKSESRFPDGDEDWADASNPTRAAANVVAVETNVVINEIMYHTHDDDPADEFVELHNRGASAVSLDGCEFIDGINFAFPAVSIPAGGFLVVARNPDRIRTVYGLPASRVVGPAQDPVSLDAFGVLANAGERLTLVDRNRNVMDTLRYYDGGDWSRWADGLGSSLELIDPASNNAVGGAWDASDDSAKASTDTFTYSGRHVGGESELHLVLMNRGIALVDDLEITSGSMLVVDATFFDFGTTWRFRKGFDEASSPVTAWRTVGFAEDGTWSSGATPIGFGEPDIVTALPDMQGAAGYMSLFLRKTFNVPNRTAVDKLFLDIRYDDGFTAYLNGTRVAERNVTGTASSSPAATAIEPTAEQIEITAFKGSLVNGTNLLAIQLHNVSSGSSDALLNARLVSGHVEVGPGQNFLPGGDFEAALGPSWIIQGTHIDSGRTTQNPLSGSGSLKVLATGRGDNKVNRIETETSTAMNTTDVYTVSFKTRWVVGSRTLLTHGYQNMDTNLARSHHLSVPDNLGTPGAVNGVTQRRIAARGSADMGPGISRVAHTPASPAAGASVTVRARIADPSGVASASVVWYLNTPGAARASAAMTDPDADGVYTAVVPGQAVGQKVLFWIEATDGLGNLERYPADVTQRSHPLLLNPGTAGPAAQDYCLYRHGPADVDARWHRYRFVMHDANESYLDSRQLHSNDLVEGTFIFGGSEVYHNSRIRFAGSPWARGRWGSFRVRFPKDRPLHGEKFSFNLDQKHGEVFGAKERISHYLFRAISRPGAPAPYAVNRIAHLWVNNRDIGHRDHVEVPNGEYLEKWWPEDDRGDFFEMDDRFEFDDAGNRIGSRDGRLTHPPYGGQADNQEEYRWYLNLRRDEDGDNYGNLIDLARVLDPGDTPDAQFDPQVDQVINAASMLRVWAVRLNTADWDQWGANRGKNCYLYRPPVDGRWHLIPWDMELTYGNPADFPHPTGASGSFGFGFGEVNRLLNRPRMRRLYYGILKEMVDGPFSSSYTNPYMTRLAALGLTSTSLGAPGGFIDQRRNMILGWINPVTSPQVDFVITSPNLGNATTVQNPVVDLAGNAPVEVSQIVVVNSALQYAPGEVPAATFSNSSMTQWSLSGVPLAPGVNNLTLLGMNSAGTTVDRDTIQVTVTGVWNAPAITQINPAAARPAESVAIAGTDFHGGIRVFFGATASPQVTYDPVADPGRLQAVVPSIAAGPYQVRVQNVDNKSSNNLPFTVRPPPTQFIRGDGNLDTRLDVTDAMVILLHLVRGRAVTCQDALDANDDGSLNVTDAIHVLFHLFRQGEAPRPPYPGRGEDPTAGDSLGCVQGLP